MCLVLAGCRARVRFVEVIDGDTTSTLTGDAHLKSACTSLGRKSDKPMPDCSRPEIARMLEDTLLVWTTEFRPQTRRRVSDEESRTHWSTSYSSWSRAADSKADWSTDLPMSMDTRCSNPVHITISGHAAQPLGLDHTRLTFRHAGRDYP